MKKIFVKTIFAAVAVVLVTLFLVTCDDLLFPQGEDGEYTDVVYSPDGNNITLYLRPDGMGEDVKPGPDTYGVPRTAAQRALSLELAKMGHDYFEAVFVSSTAVARAAWEIGMPAGISGVDRGIDYQKVAGDPAAVIFVGKKTGKTLLGIGHIVKVDNTFVAAGSPSPAPGATIGSSAKSVTFGVYPLRTQVGFRNTAALGSPPVWVLKDGKTFLTDYKGTGVSDANTEGQNVSLAAGVEYPLFKLPVVDVDTYPTLTFDPDDLDTWPNSLATYTIGGMASGAVAGLPAGDKNPGFVGVLADKPDLFTAAILAAPLEIIKRTPSFLYKGQTFDASGEVIDMYTQVEPTNNGTAGVAFDNPITMRFAQAIQSTGIFAITFQVPVYAITAAPLSDGTAGKPPLNEPDNSSNGGPPATKWYIRPGYNQYQYLLDDGEAAGGAVMLGSGVSGLDWLDIFTVGIGFSN
jgi:hypothetical protein